MKIKLDIECTPEEARAFFGLPDVAPMQQAMMEEVRERVLKSMRMTDPEVLMRTWFPLAAQGVEDLRKLFTGAAGRRPRRRDEGDD